MKSANTMRALSLCVLCCLTAATTAKVIKMQPTKIPTEKHVQKTHNFINMPGPVIQAQKNHTKKADPQNEHKHKEKTLLQSLEDLKNSDASIKHGIQILKDIEKQHEITENLRAELIENSASMLAAIDDHTTREKLAHYITQQMESLQKFYPHSENTQDIDNKKAPMLHTQSPDDNHKPTHVKPHTITPKRSHKKHKSSGLQHIHKNQPKQHHNKASKDLEQLATFADSHSQTKQSPKKQSPLLGSDSKTWAPQQETSTKKHHIVGNNPATWGPGNQSHTKHTMLGKDSKTHTPKPHTSQPKKAHTKLGGNPATWSPQNTHKKHHTLLGTDPKTYGPANHQQSLGSQGHGQARQALVDSKNDHIGYYDVSDKTLMLHGNKYHMEWEANTGSNSQSYHGKKLLGFITQEQDKKVFHPTESGWNGTSGMAIYGSQI